VSLSPPFGAFDSVSSDSVSSDWAAKRVTPKGSVH
jgi:hypothetical protein